MVDPELSLCLSVNMNQHVVLQVRGQRGGASELLIRPFSSSLTSDLTAGLLLWRPGLKWELPGSVICLRQNQTDPVHKNGRSIIDASTSADL